MKKTISLCTLLMCAPAFASGNTQQAGRNIIDEFEDRERYCNHQFCYAFSWVAACYCCAVCCGPRQAPDQISRQEPPQINAFTGKLEQKKRA